MARTNGTTRLMSDKPWTKIYVVRHGQTEWNASGRWQGWLDSDLTDIGRQQAVDAGQKLKTSGAIALYSSDAGRALATARIIGEALNLQPIAEQGLRERFYGEYEGLTSEEIDQRFPNTRYLAGRDKRDTWRPIGGESLVEVGARVMTTFRLIAGQHPGEAVIAVTHAGVLRVLDALSSRESLDDIWDRVPGNCCIFELEASLAGDLKVVNHFSSFQE